MSEYNPLDDDYSDDDFDAAVDLAREALVGYPRPKFVEVEAILQEALGISAEDAQYIVYVASSL
jgi:hypothetical protein